MKKTMMMAVTALMLSTSIQPVLAAGRGGFMGFIAGCCFGLRTGGAYNEGKEVHWREWLALVTIVGLGMAIWSGIEGAGGMTTSDYAEKYGSAFY